MSEPATALEAELTRLSRLGHLGVRVERVATSARGDVGYREGERPLAPTLRVVVQAGVTQAASFVVLSLFVALVVAELALARLVLALDVTDRYVMMAAIVVAGLLLVVPARAVRSFRLTLSPSELVVEPPRLLAWLRPTSLPIARVTRLEHREPHGRTTLVAVTEDGEQELLAGLLAATRVADLPRLFAAYRVLLDAR